MSVGTPIDRIEGRLKVTGAADYASDRILDGMLYGVPVGSTIAAGRVLRVDATDALAVPGVVAVYDHTNIGTLHSHGSSSLKTGIVDEHRAPLSGDDVQYYGQYVALVVAQTFEQAAAAAQLVRIQYDQSEDKFDLSAVKDTSFKPKPGFGGPPDTAWELAQAWPDAELHLVAGGHYELTVWNIASGKLEAVWTLTGCKGPHGLAYDHRLINGRDAAAFLNALKEDLP